MLLLDLYGGFISSPILVIGKNTDVEGWQSLVYRAALEMPYGFFPSEVQILYPPPSLAEASYGGHSPLAREGVIIWQCMHHVYNLKCVDGSIYTGCTNDLNDRLKRHKKGQVKSTEDRLPVELICYIAFANKHKAFEFEKYLKTGSGRAFVKKTF